MAGRQDDKGFLSRWAERKRDAQQSESLAEEGPEPDRGEEAALAARQSGETPGQEPEPEFDLKDLPDIETLDKGSDFSVFMNEKVPDALRRRALRRLWKVDPVFGFRDGMNDYDEDYTDAAMVVEGMKTIYQVGKGMLTPEEPDEAEAPDEEVAAAGDPGDAAASPTEPQEAEKRDPEQRRDRPEEALSSESATVDDPAPLTGPSVSPDRPLDSGGAPVSRGIKSAVRRRWGDGSG